MIVRAQNQVPTPPAMSRKASAAPPEEAAEDFVRFCYARRPVAWPELYDEMCAVAARGVFRGWGFTELSEQGIRFTLADLPRLAGLVREIADQERSRRTLGA